MCDASNVYRRVGGVLQAAESMGRSFQVVYRYVRRRDDPTHPTGFPAPIGKAGTADIYDLDETDQWAANYIPPRGGGRRTGESE